MLKKVIISFIFLLSTFFLVACQDKKVQSDDHFGYNTDYIKKEFNLNSFNLESEDPELLYINEDNELLRFRASHPDDYEYIDYIVITATNPENLFSYLEQVNQFMDLYTEKDSNLLFELCNTDINTDPIYPTLPELLGEEKINDNTYQFCYIFTENFNRYTYMLRIFA